MVLPGEFHKSYTQIEKSLKRFAPQPLKWDLPDNSASKVRLLPWQKELVDKLEDPPVDRRDLGRFPEREEPLADVFEMQLQEEAFQS